MYDGGISVVTDEPAAGPAEQPGLPVVIDTTRPHQARVYDYWLGGKDNFAVDREAAERALAVYPGLRRGVRAQRAFLANAVEYLTRTAGVRQFLDIGTGIPTANNTHEVAHAADPGARIVYVDNGHRLSGSVHGAGQAHGTGSNSDRLRVHQGQHG